ncbi:phage minor capsid protein [Eubacteriales bacterium OttesenSCG-928-A19]|nr:phage minor capsid protein [Eubacteriales bacterium OttesenSCG-928-A19]
MLTFRQLEDAGDAVVRIMAETEQALINDMARRIARLGKVTDTTSLQAQRLALMNTTQETITKELARALNMTEQRIVELFDEAATRALALDDQMFRAAGYEPVPLAENPYLQQLIRAGLTKTLMEYQNLTLTTAKTATLQFERALDLAYKEIASGGYTYQQAIRDGIRTLTRGGIESIRYPTGWVDHLDVAFRRATLTGINQTAAEIQLANISMMGTDLVETTAHPGARPEHATWQGRVFSVSGTHALYPDFRRETGYGTGPGLCGWNCRHSFFPFFEGLSDSAYPADKLREYNNKMVTYNDKTMSLYDATQQQRYIERKIRRWKREDNAMAVAGDFDASWKAHDRVLYWQSVQRDFIKQTGLRRDYFRERAGAQVVK